MSTFLPWHLKGHKTKKRGVWDECAHACAVHTLESTLNLNYVSLIFVHAHACSCLSFVCHAIYFRGDRCLHAPSLWLLDDNTHHDGGGNGHCGRTVVVVAVVHADVDGEAAAALLVVLLFGLGRLGRLFAALLDPLVDIVNDVLVLVENRVDFDEVKEGRNLREADEQAGMNE